MPSRLARWTLAYVAAALACFVGAQVVLVGGWGLAGGALQAPATLAAVHLLTIGWLTLLMFAALRQFVPVITASRPKGDAVALPALIAVTGGLTAMVIGFLALGQPYAWASLPWLPVGGSAVVVGLVLLAAVVGAALVEARPLPLAGRFVAAGVVCLVLTIAMGLTMAVALSRPHLLSGRAVGAVLTRGLELHAGIGLLGWFTLTAIGVSYKLLPMFTLAPEGRGALGHAVFGLTVGGMALVGLTGLFGLLASGGPVSPVLAQSLQRASWLVVGAGLTAYLGDMTRLYRQRRRRALELNAGFARAALLALAAGIALLAAGTAFGFAGAQAGPIAYLLLFGWLSGLALTQLYKIVPFLTWIERYGPSLGKGPVPRVQDLVDENAARPWFALYFAAVALGVLAGLLGFQRFWQWTSAGVLAATLGITVELWRAGRRRPAQPGAMRPAGPTQPPAFGARSRASVTTHADRGPRT